MNLIPVETRFASVDKPKNKLLSKSKKNKSNQSSKVNGLNAVCNNLSPEPVTASEKLIQIQSKSQRSPREASPGKIRVNNADLLEEIGQSDRRALELTGQAAAAARRQAAVADGVDSGKVKREME